MIHLHHQHSVQLNVLSLQLPVSPAQQSQPIVKETQYSNFFKHNHQFDMISIISLQYKPHYKARFFGNSQAEKGTPFKQGLTHFHELYVKCNAMLRFVMLTCSISSVICIFFLILYLSVCVGQDSAVSIAACYMLDGLGIKYQRGRDLP